MGTKEEGERADAHVFQFDLVPKFPCSLQMEAKNPLLPICKHFPPLLLLLVGHGRSALVLLLLPFSSAASNANSCCCKQSGSKEKRVYACCPLCCCFCSSCCFYFVKQESSLLLISGVWGKLFSSSRIFEEAGKQGSKKEGEFGSSAKQASKQEEIVIENFPVCWGRERERRMGGGRRLALSFAVRSLRRRSALNILPSSSYAAIHLVAPLPLRVYCLWSLFSAILCTKETGTCWAMVS